MPEDAGLGEERVGVLFFKGRGDAGLVPALLRVGVNDEDGETMRPTVATGRVGAW